MATPKQPTKQPTKSPAPVAPAAGKADAANATALSVKSKVEGFRRAGRAWSKTPTTVPLAELSDAQILELEAEPRLLVTYLADEAQ